MAFSAKFLSSILLLSILSSQIHARDSNFFSKVSHDNNVQDTNKNFKDVQLTTKEEPLDKQKPEPKQTFKSEDENSYGFYGQEDSQTTNYAPYITTADGGRIYDLDKDPLLKNQENMAETMFQEKHESYTPITNQNNNNYYKHANGYHPDEQEDRFARNSYTNKAYEDNYNNDQNRYGRNGYNNYDKQPNFHYNGGNYNNQQQGQRFRDTRLADNGYSTMANQNNYQYNGGNMYNNVQKQGLSDTRFLENGRYYYDISKDKYNPDHYDNDGAMSSRNEYNRNFYDNNEYNNKNYMGGYRNQEEFEENNDQFMP